MCFFFRVRLFFRGRSSGGSFLLCFCGRLFCSHAIGDREGPGKLSNRVCSKGLEGGSSVFFFRLDASRKSLSPLAVCFVQHFFLRCRGNSKMSKIMEQKSVPGRCDFGKAGSPFLVIVRCAASRISSSGGCRAVFYRRFCDERFLLARESKK